jgi:methyl-accepting chemotaxis protein
VTDIMGEITSASREQSVGIDEVNQAIGQMDQVTQQNAALVEEAAAAAESMQHQSQALAQAVSVFKIARVAPAARPLHRDPTVQVEDSEIEVNTPMERRGPNRATNVSRLPPKSTRVAAAGATPAKTGTDADWSEF